MTDGRLLLHETQCCLWQKIAIAKDCLLTDHLYVCHCLKWPHNKKMVVDCILVIKAIGKPFFPDQIYILGKRNHWLSTLGAIPNFATERARALKALGLLLADGTPTVGGGKTF